MNQDEPGGPTQRRMEWWVRLAFVAVLLQSACFWIPYLRPGHAGMILWLVGLDGILWPGFALILLLWGLIRSLLRRPFFTGRRMLGYVVCLILVVFPFFVATLPFLFIPYPSSHNDSPSRVRFRVPLDGPVTVFWGGRWPINNYHAIAPDQCRAYDLLVTKQDESCQGDGKLLEDYYCYGLPVLAPADGTVRSVVDGHPNMPPGQLGGRSAGGNQLVIEVAPGEFLFLCHMQPGSFTVKPGDRVETGQILGRVGNSGNTSEPHLHIHLQDTPKDTFGEGIPLYFHRYRLNGRLVERGLPTGGLTDRQIIEHVPAEADERRRTED